MLVLPTNLPGVINGMIVELEHAAVTAAACEKILHYRDHFTISFRAYGGFFKITVHLAGLSDAHAAAAYAGGDRSVYENAPAPSPSSEYGYVIAHRSPPRRGEWTATMAPPND